MCSIVRGTDFMPYRIAELKNIGKRVHNQCNPSRVLINLLESFDILRDQINSIHFCKVLVRKVTSQINGQVLCYVSEFFNVSRRDVNILKENFVENIVVCLIKFAKLSNYIQFENIVLPHNLTLLNKVNNKSRVKSTVNYSSLINVKIENVFVECDSGMMILAMTRHVVDKCRLPLHGCLLFVFVIAC